MKDVSKSIFGIWNVLKGFAMIFIRNLEIIVIKDEFCVIAESF
jgi:hypothetical protein